MKQTASMNGMEERPKSGFRGAVLVWIVGLTLGVAAGAATAMLLMPSNGSRNSLQSAIADRFR
ncbi:hypothetical protein FJQ54_06800 [Sandaracinobacter neustonicus]|uniref:Uncharacterized protein n=1 Tax=Sandaracinobacter neustonicus TaxID=1715348 RepID=A0A501XNI6_9SPHN|nr:hypothetical protein [Sandaracinobacter neustonicus]TPE62232.1 hypothetical protein FJQ54_06800 [Sandaracinobacter neustonicus]